MSYLPPPPTPSLHAVTIVSVLPFPHPPPLIYASRELLLHHCEKKALAYLLQHVDVAGIGSTSASTSANPPSSTPSSASGGLGTMGGLGSVGVLDQSLGNSAPTVHTHMAHTPTANRARATPPTPSGGLEPLGEASMQLLSRRDNELRDRRGKVNNVTNPYTTSPYSS